MNNSTYQYEIKVPGKSSLFTSVEESALKYLLNYPDTQLYIRTWYEGEAPPSDRIEITKLVREAIVLGRGRG